jgi:uncharacterized protein
MQPSGIVDAHAHCGRQDRSPPQALEDYLEHSEGSDIGGAVMFPPVYEIYDRYDYSFEDDDTWRCRRDAANRYLIELETNFEVVPFYFIWNDFAVDKITSSHRGIKWHRHSDEPEYHYDDPRCATVLAEIRRRNMPICLEEEWHKTMMFINELASGIRIIIPHCGLLNGGYEKFRQHDIWARPDVFTDTALAPADLITDYVNRYGSERIMFGSDFPFGDPRYELRKILRLRLTDDQKEALIGGNVRRLLSGVAGAAG